MTLKFRLLFAIAILVEFNIMMISTSEVNDKFLQHEVSPDILDSLPNDLWALNITYGTNWTVSLGNELKQSQVQERPTVSWPSVQSTDTIYYTLLMTDPDAPSRAEPSRREIRHWLVVNILFNDLSSGYEAVTYRGSMPPEGSGLHRYIFLLFKQNGLIRISSDATNLPNNETDRANTSTKLLMSNFTLTLVGGDLFQAQYETGKAGLISTNTFLIIGMILTQVLYAFHKF